MFGPFADTGQPFQNTHFEVLPTDLSVQFEAVFTYVSQNVVLNLGGSKIYIFLLNTYLRNDIFMSYT